jgi:Rieske Fe-S protein
VRGKGAALVLATALFTISGIVAFLAQRPPVEPAGPPFAVAKVADVTMTPRPVQVLMERGLDRIMQRQRTSSFPCGTAGGMGCPGSVEVQPVKVFLVRDESGSLHAFIGEDPRNGCALDWLEERPEVRTPAVFHDRCHGSLYDRRGHVVGGPSPWDLNELAAEERGEQIYIDPRSILVGACSGCPRP